MVASPVTTPRESHTPVQEFRRFEKTVIVREPVWLATLRRSGWQQFRKLGFPATGHEDWRFTNLSPMVRLPFRPAGEPAELALPALQDLTLGRLAGPRLVFVDGHYCPGLSCRDGLPAEVTLDNLAVQLKEETATAAELLGRRLCAAEHGLTALNTAFFRDGAILQIPDGCVVEPPIQWLHLSTGPEPGTVAHVRHLIQVGARSQCTVVENYLSLGGAAHVTNTVTELQVGEDARVEHLKYQDQSAQSFHVGTLSGEFGRGSRVSLHSFALGSRLSRYDLRVRLAGEGLECVLNGLYLTKGDQLADHHMVVEHAQAQCASHEYFNGILDDQSRGVFHGRILVQPEAQKTDAKQTNKNLLLSDQATVDTKPQLEIYADDVKCTHGATVGQLNPESIFYLRSRGIGQETARRMLIHAFAGEIIERVQSAPVRAELDRLVWTRLEQNPHISGRV